MAAQQTFQQIEKTAAMNDLIYIDFSPRFNAFSNTYKGAKLVIQFGLKSSIQLLRTSKQNGAVTSKLQTNVLNWAQNISK